MAAKWSWQSDSGWVPYAPAVSAVIEAGFQKKEKRVKVDQERFIDIADMLQRRYDDESKRRQVKREIDTSAPPPPPSAPVIFKNEIFYILASSQKKKEKLSDDAAKYGALIAEHFVPPKAAALACVTHVVCSEADVPSFDAVLAGMVKSGVEMVTPEFISDSIVEEELQNAAKYRLSVKKNYVAAPAAPAAVPAAAPAVAAGVPLQLEGIKCAPYPFELVVESVSNDKFNGYIYWPTLGKTKTKVSGKISGTAVTFEETDFMEGDGVELNNKYTGTLSAAGMAGKLTDTLGLEGHFELKLK